MAIISSYPIQGNPSLSDYVIGTDSVNSDATVNFLISDIIGLANLPTTYVPYSGATADVNLGSHNLNMNSGYITFPSNTGIIMPGGSSIIGTVGQLNSVTSNTNNIIINNYIDIVNAYTEIRLGGDAGLAGQVLTSAGPSTRPTWSTISSNLKKGSFYDSLQQVTVGATPTAILLRNTDTASTNGVSIVSNSQITFSTAGTYNIAYSAQLTSASSGNGHTATFYLRKNGTISVAATSRQSTAFANTSNFVSSCSWFITVTAGDYIELMCYTSSANLTVSPISGSIGTFPSAPSVVVTVNQV